MDDRVYWLALQGYQHKIDVSSLPRIVKKFGSIEKFFLETPRNLKGIGWSEQQINRFYEYAKSFDLGKYINLHSEIEGQNIRIITYLDKEYPEPLQNAVTNRFEPPILLLVKGSIGDLSKCIAIVGNRKATESALQNAYDIAYELASSGYTIASGLARGIDRMAHLGALEAKNGRTISTLAWHNPVYPPENAGLASEIEQRGAVISELLYSPNPEGDQFTRSQFVFRNRIISGISRSVIAVESGASGGTIHQVEIAVAQKRPVYTLQPTNASDVDKTRGYLEMIRKGAKQFESVDAMLSFPQFRQAKLGV